MQQPHERVTMRLIAEKLGVTKTTVSLALRGSRNISPPTRERVLKLAKELNYRPDPAIAAIASHRWNGNMSEKLRILACLCHEENLNCQDIYIQMANERAEELGYRIDTFCVEKYPNAEAISRVLYHRGIRGVMILPIQNPDSTPVTHLKWDQFTAVCCGIGRTRPPLHTISSDTFNKVRMAWEIVAKAGFTRIGATLSWHHPSAEDDWVRLGASRASLEMLHLEESAAIPFLTTDVNEEEALLNWYHTYKPQVIIGFNHRTGEILEQHGIRMPEDVELVSLIAPPGSKWSGITRQLEQVAITSVDILHNEIRENRWGLPEHPHVILIEPEWNDGTTFRNHQIAKQLIAQLGNSRGPENISKANHADPANTADQEIRTT